MPENYDAVVAGQLCLDIIPQFPDGITGQFDRLFVPGRLLEVSRVTLSTGGAVSNTGLALNRLGIPTRLMGKVGDDLFGQAVQQIIASYGPGLLDAMVVDPGVSTSYTLIISPPGTDRMFLYFPGANATFSADDVRYELVSEARLFHFGYPPLLRRMVEDDGVQLVDVLRRARETGVTTSLDTAFPDPLSAAGRADWATILGSALPYVDIFLPSIEEILYMLRRNTYDELSSTAGGGSFLPLVTPELLSDLGRELLDMGARIVGLKLGDRGLYVRTADVLAIESLGRARPTESAVWADKEMWAPCFKVDMVGTTGAGDAAIAGFLSALLRDWPPEAATTAAVAVGACNVEADDALGGIRTWDETLDRMSEDWARHPLKLESPGWRFNDEHHLWVRAR